MGKEGRALKELSDEEQIFHLIWWNYFQCYQQKRFDEHFAAFTEDVRTWIGNREAVRDNNLDEYKHRMTKLEKWIAKDYPAHRMNPHNIKIMIDGKSTEGISKDMNLATATAWLVDPDSQPTPWFDAFSLRKENGQWKIFRLRWIPEGGWPETGGI